MTTLAFAHTTAEPTPAHLIGAVAAGDGRALGLLYLRFAPALLALATRLVRRRAEAEDLLHDVFLEVGRFAGGYDPDRGSVETWLKVRVRSRAFDCRRSMSLRDDLPLADGFDVPAPAPPVDADRAHIRAALRSLPEPRRRVVELAYWEQLSHSEIAERLAMPIGTVKSRISRSLRVLRKRLRSTRRGPVHALSALGSGHLRVRGLHEENA